MSPRVWSPERDVPRPVVVTRSLSLFWLTLLAALLVLSLVGLETFAEVSEVELDAIEVRMDDPFPCETDPQLRLTYLRVGAVCRPLKPP